MIEYSKRKEKNIIKREMEDVKKYQIELLQLKNTVSEM